MPIGFRFDAKNLAAQKVAMLQAARMVTGVSNETRDAIRMLIVRSIREGIPPYEAARMIRSMIGLTNKGTSAAMNYRIGLIEQGHGLDRVNTLVERYTAKSIRRRALTIARTETMGALNKGTLVSWDQAKKEGFLSETAGKEFIVTPDEKLCDICAPLGEEDPIPLKESFSGGYDAPPIHPNCRCTMGIAELKGGEKEYRDLREVPSERVPLRRREELGAATRSLPLGKKVGVGVPIRVLDRVIAEFKELAGKFSADKGVSKKALEKLQEHIKTLPGPMQDALRGIELRIISGSIPMHEEAIGLWQGGILNRITLRVMKGRKSLEEVLRHEIAHAMDRGNLSSKINAAWQKDVATFGKRRGDFFVTHYKLNEREGFAQAMSYLTGKIADAAEFRAAFKNAIEAVRDVLDDLGIEVIR